MKVRIRNQFTCEDIATIVGKSVREVTQNPDGSIEIEFDRTDFTATELSNARIAIKTALPVIEKIV